MNVFTFVGGIKGLAAENDSAKKWCLNTPEQAKDKCSKTNGMCDKFG